nr:hypothetical protein [Kofleriaceae bacterium]
GAACTYAQFFAAAASPVLLVPQTMLDRYYDRYRRAVEAEPWMPGGVPTTKYFLYVLETNDVRIGTAWQAKQLVTGIPEFDNVFSQIAASITAVHTGDGNYVAIDFKVKRLVSPEQFNRAIPNALAQSPIVGEGLEWPLATFSWPEGSPREGADDLTATIDSAFAFTDCFVGCAKHYLRAVVSPTDVIVYDMGGEPFPVDWPAEFMLRPTTIPWPGPLPPR